MTIDWSAHRVWSADQIRAATAEAQSGWGLPIEVEVRRRILLSVATYAYEIVDAPIMSDQSWDLIAQTINPQLGTCHPVIDEFFATHFSPMTGMWIHSHPELDKIRRLFENYYVGAVREQCERARARR